MEVFREKGFERLFEKRMLVLTGGITEKKIEELEGKFLDLCSRSNEEIKLIINTKGGNFGAAIHFFDFLRVIKPEVTGIVVENCQSSGIVVLQACGKRLATPNSHLLVHSISFGFKISAAKEPDETRKSFEERLADCYLHQEIMNKILTERTNLSEKVIKNIIRRGDNDITLTTRPAKELNLIDEIIYNFEINLT